MHRIWITLAAIALVAVGAAGATFIGSGSGTEEFAASFEAQAISDPEITACPGLVGPDGRKLEAEYVGTFETGTDNYYAITLRLELLLIDSDASLGSAEGGWTLTRADGGVVADGELVAVAKGPSDETSLHGMLIGVEYPPDPILPQRMLLANFSASLRDGFRSVVGAMGDQELAPNPAVLLPPDPC